MRNSILYQLGIHRLNMNEDNESWGVIVTNNHQHDEAVIEENAVQEYAEQGISEPNCGRYKCDLI